MDNRLAGTFIIGYDLSNDENGDIEGCLLVGIRDGARNKVVNMFTGKEALDIYKILTTKKEKKTNE